MTTKQIPSPHPPDPPKGRKIRTEIARLNKIFNDLPANKLNLAKGLIESASFMKVTLSDMEKDLLKNGSVGYYSQSPDLPTFERTRPVAQLYNTMNKNYQTIIKQLTDMLPKDESIVRSELDTFNDER